MITAFAIGLTADVAYAHVISCTGQQEVVEEPTDRLSEIHFISRGWKISDVVMINPPSFAVVYAPGERTEDGDWTGKRTNNGFVFKANGHRARGLEPGRVELTAKDGKSEQLLMKWDSFVVGGHVPFVDSGKGTCRHWGTPLHAGEPK